MFNFTKEESQIIEEVKFHLYNSRDSIARLYALNGYRITEKGNSKQFNAHDLDSALKYRTGLFDAAQKFRQFQQELDQLFGTVPDEIRTEIKNVP